MRRSGVFAAALVVAGLTAAVAAPSLHYDLIYDDEAIVVERKPFWELGASAFVQSAPWVTGRHLTAVSFDLDRLAAGEPPRALPYHRTNILLAAMLSVLVLAFALRLGLSPLAAAVAAAIFGVHPTHVDAVVSVVGRAEMLAAMGCLAVLLVCVRAPVRGFRGQAPNLDPSGLVARSLRGSEPDPELLDPGLPRRRAAWIAAGSAFFGVLAVHSKESALCLPLLVVLARWCLGPRVAWMPALAGTGVAVLSWAALTGLAMTSIEKTQFVDNPLIYAPVFEQVPKALAILWHYALLLVWPHPLLLDRSWAQTDPGVTTGWFATIAWIAAAAAAWSLRRRAPLVAFALAWFPVAFAISGNVVKPIGTIMAERLLLLPSLGVCLLAGLAVDALAKTTARRRAALAASVVVVAVLFALFRVRAAPWRSGDVYFATSAAASPLSAKAQYDYGNWLLRKGDRLEAEAAYARALAIVPDFSRAASYRAESMAARGDAAGGAEVYLAYLAARPKPDDTGAITNLTRLLLHAGRPEEAVSWARKLVELLPGDSKALDTLVIAETALRRAKPE